MDQDAFDRLNQWGGWEEEGSRLARSFFDQNPQVLPEGLPYAYRARIAEQAGEAFLLSIWQRERWLVPEPCSSASRKEYRRNSY